MKSIQLKTKRLRLCLATDEEIATLIEREQNTCLQKAYSDILEVSQTHPETRVWYAAWLMKLPDGKTAGYLRFHGEPVDGEVEISGDVLPEYEQQDYAAEAVQKMVEWAFSQNGAYLIFAEAERGKTAFRHALEKCGFLPPREGAKSARLEIEKSVTSWIAIYMCLGMSVGLSLGVAFSNLALGMCLGMACGMALGAAMDSAERQKRETFRKNRARRMAQSQQS